MSSWEPIPTKRNYDRERKILPLHVTPTSIHPLRLHSQTSGVAKNVSKDECHRTVSNSLQAFNDPLSSKTADPLLDPLSALSSMTLRSTKEESVKSPLDESIDKLWESKKQQISKRFAYCGDIILSSNAINEFDGSGVEDGSSKRYLDRYTQRLATLEKRNVTDANVQLSLGEYEQHIRKLSDNLMNAWKNDERVLSLKIAIMIARLLADTTIEKFYPSAFVLITTELDKFGSMVFERLRSKAEEALSEDFPVSRKKSVKFPDNFKSSEVPSLAREICRNWFYKIACIRELIPRFYIETALLRCYKFLTDDDYPQILSRLTSIARGIGNPLVSIYARLYLQVIGSIIYKDISTDSSANFHSALVYDMLYQFKLFNDESFFQQTKIKISAKEYFRLISPAVDWLIKSTSTHATRQSFQVILSQYRECCNDSLVLKYILDYYNVNCYEHALLGMITLIKSATFTFFTVVDLFTSLGKQLLLNFPLKAAEPSQKLAILNEVWKIVSKCDDLNSYIRCSAIWIELIQRHYSQREMVVILTDVGSKIEKYTKEKEPAPEYVQKQLESLILSLMSDPDASYGSALISSENILKILEIFPPSKKVHLCQEILTAFKHYTPTNDVNVINTMFYICRVLHDSIDSLSSEGERHHVSTLLSTFIYKIDFGRDLEQQLNIYTECRALLYNLDDIKKVLVFCVCSLGFKLIRFTRGKHTKKTSAFAKSCLAYCYITIPSIQDIFQKVELLLLCSEVALLNQCLPQTDAFLKALILLIPELPTYEEIDHKRTHTEVRLAAFIRQLLSFLILVPGHPEHGPFYIIKGLLNAIPRFSWQPHTGHQVSVYIDLIGVIAAMKQERLPYHVQYVESNDDLYGGTETYMSELKDLMELTIASVMKQLTVLGESLEPTAKAQQAHFCVDFVNQILSRLEVKSPEGATFVTNLMRLANLARANLSRQDAKYYDNTLKYIQSLASENASLITVVPTLTQ